MKKNISVKDIEAPITKGGRVSTPPANAIITLPARGWSGSNAGRRAPKAARRPAKTTGRPAAPAGKPAKPINSKSSQAELEALFHSPRCHELKVQFCDIGRRLWQRAYVGGNAGNLAIRLGEDIALCTPTMVSKGFMKPEDMCLVDFEGNQLCGAKKRTSEILMHLQIMKRQPKAVATCHCHPPYGTGFAVAGLVPPTRLIPEYEVLSSVAVAPYRTPGTPEMGQLVADLVDKHNTILMANHGVVSWSHHDVEDAYFKIEILEAYCRTVLVAAQLGKPVNTLTPAQLQELLKLKQSLGIPDPRFGLKESELCDHDEWRPGVTCAVPAKAVEETAASLEAETLVQTITDQILAKLK